MQAWIDRLPIPLYVADMPRTRPFLPLVLALLAIACETGGASDDAAADAGAAAGGLGCACSTAADCAAGFCSSLRVCTTSDAVECQSDADCDCGARCVVFGENRSCQIPCVATDDCPGDLECAPLDAPWTTTAGVALVSGCVAPTGGGGGAGGGGAGGGGGGTVTWDGDIRPIVQEKCQGCHLDGGTSGGVHFDTWADTQVVVDNCPPGTSSRVADLMARKVSPNPPCGARMPLVGGPLSDEQVQLFAAWAAAGAPEN
jgi:hypothetical protein